MQTGCSDSSRPITTVADCRRDYYNSTIACVVIYGSARSETDVGRSVSAGRRVVCLCVCGWSRCVVQSAHRGNSLCSSAHPPPTSVQSARRSIGRRGVARSLCTTWRAWHICAVPLRRSVVYLQLLNLSQRRSYFLTHAHATNLL